MNGRAKILLLCTIWNILIFSFFSYIIFYKGESGWWYFFMVMIGGTPSKYMQEKVPYEGPND